MDYILRILVLIESYENDENFLDTNTKLTVNNQNNLNF